MIKLKRTEIEYAVFDMDGTLVDSMEAWYTAADRLLLSWNIQPRPGLYDEIKALTTKQVAEYLKANYGVEKTEEELPELINGTMVDFYNNDATLKDGALILLEELKRCGIGMCIATATDRYLAEPVLKRLGIYDYFDCVLTCSELGAGKSEPVVFDEALRISGCSKKKTWIFEDSYFAMTTAKKSGYPVAAVYDLSSANTEELKKAEADIYLSELKELVIV